MQTVTDFKTAANGWADAFQAALAADLASVKVAGARQGARVYFPRGQYPVLKPLKIDGWTAGATVHVEVLLHPAATLSFEGTVSSESALFDLSTDCGKGGSIVLTGGRISGGKMAASQPLHGVRSTVGNVTVRDMLVDGFPRDGILFVPPTKGTTVPENRVEGCRVCDNRGCGVRAVSADNLVLTANRVQANAEWGGRLSGTGLVVDSCWLRGNGTAGQAGNLLVEGLGSQDTGTDATITGSVFLDHARQSKPCIRVDGGVSGFVARATVVGCSLKGSRGTASGGNTGIGCVGTTRYLYVEGCSFSGFRFGVQCRD